MDINFVIGTIIPTAVGGLSAIWAIKAYKEGQKLKTKEVLFELSEEFDKSEAMLDAKLILDDYVIKYEKEWKKSIVSYGIPWDDIKGDYTPLKDYLKGEGFDWIDNQDFIKNEGSNSIMISDEDHFLSIMISEKLPYCVNVLSLEKMIFPESKRNYRYMYYLYGNIIDNKVGHLGHYYHKSNLKYILRNHSDIPIMEKGEAHIRQSFDSLLNFFVKLGYLVEGKGLVGNEELLFFSSYVIKAYRMDAVKDYISYYNFRLTDGT